jgi:hypothetical protein
LPVNLYLTTKMAAVASSTITTNGTSTSSTDTLTSITSSIPKDITLYTPESKALVSLGHFSVSDVADVPSPTVLIIGHPLLRVKCTSIPKDDIKRDTTFLQQRRQLHRALVPDALSLLSCHRNC